MRGPSFFFTDEAFQPVTITHERQWTCLVPMAPPMYEVRLNTNITRESFQGSATNPHDARRIAVQKMYDYLRRHAFVSAELSVIGETFAPNKKKTHTGFSSRV